MGKAAATPEVLRVLVESVGEGKWGVCFVAADALRRMGASAARPEVLRALTERLRDEDPDVREAAAMALEGMEVRGG
jgi:HEAT repeat protein